jgi:hypothetical protein
LAFPLLELGMRGLGSGRHITLMGLGELPWMYEEP